LIQTTLGPGVNRLADSFARAGYIVVAPDMFNGSPAPGDINVPGFNTTEFLAKHGPNATDPIVAAAVKYMRGTLGLTRVGATGYCFGGKYSFRAGGLNGSAEAKGADVVFAAHPSLLVDGEIVAVGGPASVAAAGKFHPLAMSRTRLFSGKGTRSGGC